MKSNIASVDHLKEIERLKGLLATAEGSIRTLTAQLHSKESGAYTSSCVLCAVLLFKGQVISCVAD